MAAIIKYHKLGELQQQTFILSRFWKLEVRNQLSAGWFLFCRFLRGIDLVLYPSIRSLLTILDGPQLIYRCIIPISASMFTWLSLVCALSLLFLVSVSLHPNFSLLVRTPVIELRSTLIQYDLTLLDYIFKVFLKSLL